MTPEAAFQSFMSGFGIPAYTTASVPEDATYPYITYALAIGEWSEGEVNVSVDVWYRTESEAIPNAKVRQLYDRIGLGGVTVPCDNGMLWIKRGRPWAQAVEVEGADESIKRRYVNINVEYFIP